MAFGIPNDVAGGTAKQHAQAAPDSVDIDILIAGHNLTGVQSGCAVTAQGSPNMTLAVASGTVGVAGVAATVTSGNVTITAAHAGLPRFDLVVVNSSGTKSVTAGTPAAAPVFPAMPASSVVLAAVYVGAGVTSIATADIVDKRVIVNSTTYGPLATAHKPTAAFPSAEASLTKITTWQSGHGWTATNNDAATNLNKTTSPVIGSQYASLVSTGVGTGTPARLTKTGLTVDLTGKQIRLLVRVTNASALSNIQVFAGDSGFSNYYTWQLARYADATVQAFTKEGVWEWVTFGFEGAVATGSPNKAAITDMRVALLDDASAKITLDLAALAFCPDPSALAWPAGVISLTFDDGWGSQFTTAKPILDGYLYPATAYVISDCIDGTASLGSEGAMNLAQVQQLKQVNNWEIACHAYTLANHNLPFTGLSDAQVRAEYENQKQWIRDNDLGDGDNYAYPRGAYNSAILETTRRHFSFARSVHSFYRGETYPPADRHRLRVLVLDSGTTLATAKLGVDAALANGDWVIYVCHRVDTVASTNTWATSDMQSLIDYIATQGVPVRTVAAVMSSRNEQGIRALPSLTRAKSIFGVTALIRAGAATVANNVLPPGVAAPYATTLTKITVRAGTAPVGSSLTVRVNQNGSAITGGTLSMLTTTTSIASAALAIPVAAGDIFTFDITAIGSGTAGSDIAVDLAGVNAT